MREENSTIKSVTVCADDFGLSPGVNTAIAELAEANQISAISCLTGLPDWPESARLLSPLLGRVDIGLHLDRSCPFLEQYRRFEAELGRPPDFVDGHRHCHELPWRHAEVLALLSLIPAPFYTRNTLVRGAVVCPWKTAILSGLGGVWKRKVEALGIATNDGFTGIYDWRKQNGRSAFEAFAQKIDGGRPLWMVHPGIPDSVLSARDPFVEGRQLEFNLLRDNFLARHGLRCVRFFGATTARKTDHGLSTLPSPLASNR